MIEERQERDELLKSIECLKAENEEIRSRLKTVINDLENKEIFLANAEKKIEWYKGQIEAYQFCLNCRR